VLLLTTAALPQLDAHRHPQLGRLITPRHRCRLAATLDAGYPVAADNDCFTGLDALAVCRMLEAITPWPSVGARVARAWPTMRTSIETLTVRRARGGARRRDATPPARPHPNLLWIAVPDVVRCACGQPRPCSGSARGPGCEPVGDAEATLEQFRTWHMWLCHVPLAFVLQDGAERPGRVPWDAPGLAAVFVAGSTAWKLGPAAAALVGHARQRGLHAHMGRVSTAQRIRYAHSIGCTSFDSSRYSRWRELLLDDGLARAAQPPQLRLIA
jgi:hypothetical protein